MTQPPPIAGNDGTTCDLARNAQAQAPIVRRGRSWAGQVQIFLPTHNLRARPVRLDVRLSLAGLVCLAAGAADAAPISRHMIADRSAAWLTELYRRDPAAGSPACSASQAPGPDLAIRYRCRVGGSVEVWEARSPDGESVEVAPVDAAAQARAAAAPSSLTAPADPGLARLGAAAPR